jgi:dolichol-phosphate mannosyltransferase
MCEKYDVVVGSKYTCGGAVEGLSWWRRMLSAYGNKYIRYVLSLKRPDFQLKDSTSGYIAWRRGVLEALSLDSIKSKGYGFLVELKWRAFLQGAQIWEEPIVFRDRVRGRSKLTSSIVWEVLVLPLKLLTFRGGF